MLVGHRGLDAAAHAAEDVQLQLASKPALNWLPVSMALLPAPPVMPPAPLWPALAIVPVRLAEAVAPSVG